MPKYRVDRLISLPAAMAANGVDSSMHNQPCAIMLFTAFYNDLPRRATTIAGRAPTSKVPRNSPHSAYTESDDRTSWLWLNVRPPEMCECLIVASAPVLSTSLSSSPLDPGDAAYGVFSRCLPGSRSDWVGISKQGDSCIECSGPVEANNIVFFAWICYRFLRYRHS